SELFAEILCGSDVEMRVWPGLPYPLGAAWDGRGVNFALFSEHATKVELCLFDSSAARRETQRIVLPEQTDQVWHGYFPDLKPGQYYAYPRPGPRRDFAPAQSRAGPPPPASTARTSRPRGIASIPRKSCSIPTPVRSAA